MSATSDELIEEFRERYPGISFLVSNSDLGGRRHTYRVKKGQVSVEFHRRGNGRFVINFRGLPVPDTRMSPNDPQRSPSLRTSLSDAVAAVELGDQYWHSQLVKTVSDRLCSTRRKAEDLEKLLKRVRPLVSRDDKNLEELFDTYTVLVIHG